MLSITRLSPKLPFGVEIKGVTPEELLDETVKATLRHHFAQDGVLVFREIEQSRDMHLNLSKVWGDLQIHPISKNDYTADKEVNTVEYRGKEATIYRIDGEVRGGSLPFHTDLIYHTEINRGAVMRPVHIPPEHGKTTFADKIRAYDAIPDRLKARIEGLEVLYGFNSEQLDQKFGRAGREIERIRISERRARLNQEYMTAPRTIHPLVIVQEETGRKILNFSPYFAQGIVGMENAEGDAILHELAEIAIDPEFVYAHAWSMTDMVCWDNWRMLHGASGVHPDAERLMLRTSIGGDYGKGRLEDTRATLRAEQSISI